jgi:hypothetical protein
VLKLSKSEHKNLTDTKAKLIMMIMLMIRNKRIIIRKWQLQTVCIIHLVLCTMSIIPNNLHTTSKLLNFDSALYTINAESSNI